MFLTKYNEKTSEEGFQKWEKIWNFFLQKKKNLQKFFLKKFCHGKKLQKNSQKLIDPCRKTTFVGSDNSSILIFNPRSPRLTP